MVVDRVGRLEIGSECNPREMGLKRTLESEVLLVLFMPVEPRAPTNSEEVVVLLNSEVSSPNSYDI